MKKILLLIAIGLLLLPACTDMTYESVTSQKSPQSPSSIQGNISEQKNNQESESKSEPEIVLYKIGDTGEIGNFAFTVKDVIETKQNHDKKTENKYVIITVEAKNIVKKPEYVDSDHFVLLDAQERQYNSDNDILDWAKDKFFTLHEINPGLTFTAKVAFEVPDDASGFILAARDKNFDYGNSKYIFFNLGF
jgi:hypothetical protein